MANCYFHSLFADYSHLDTKRGLYPAITPSHARTPAQGSRHGAKLQTSSRQVGRVIGSGAAWWECSNWRVVKASSMPLHETY